MVNTSSAVTNGWTLACNSDANISSASGAKLSGTGSPYTFTNESWTGNIQPGSKVDITFGSNSTAGPGTFTDCSIDGESIAITVPDFGSGPAGIPEFSAKYRPAVAYEGAFRGELTLYNEGDTAITDWTLACDTDFTFAQTASGYDISGALVKESTATHFVLEPITEWDTTVNVGGKVVMSFGGEPAFNKDTAFQNCKFTDTQDINVQIISGAQKGMETEAITLNNLDSIDQIIYQHTIDQGTSTIEVSGADNVSVMVNNSDVLSATANGSTITLQGLSAGRSGLKISEGDKVRYVGIRVKHTDGSNPGMPEYLSVGSVSEDSDADLAFWQSFEADAQKGKRIDIRYVYLNGGPYSPELNAQYPEFDVLTGWATPQNRLNAEGGRAISFIRESLKYGMIPSFVYYNIPDGNESHLRNLSHFQNVDYLEAYFKDLKLAIDIINTEAKDELVQMIFEPDAIGYLAQNEFIVSEKMALEKTTRLNELNAKLQLTTPEALEQERLRSLQNSAGELVPFDVYTEAAYSSGLLTQGVDPDFNNDLEGFISAVNYIVERDAPNVEFGWQMNLWAIKPGGYTTAVSTKGIMHYTDLAATHATATDPNPKGYYGWEQGRTHLYNEAKAVTQYYVDAGIGSYGADFVSIDKYGLSLIHI